MTEQKRQSKVDRIGRRPLLAVVAAGLFHRAKSPFSSLQTQGEVVMNQEPLMHKRERVHSCKVEGSTGPITIFAIQTGSVSVKQNFLTAVGPNYIAKLAILADRHFATPIPIYAWLIVHPEGTFVIDTGESAASTNSRYFDAAPAIDRFINKTQLRFHVTPEDEIGPHLTRLGYPPSQVKKVLLTHLHIDHTDGLKHFEGVEILVHEAERQHPYKDLPHTYPSWFNPMLYDFQSDRAEVFGSAYPVTSGEDLLIVPTPGHTPHHASVLLRTPSVHFLFAGDLAYSQSQWLSGELAAPHADFRLARQTYNGVKAYVARRPTVFLPSHDPDSGRRLAAIEVVPV